MDIYCLNMNHSNDAKKAMVSSLFKFNSLSNSWKICPIMWAIMTFKLFYKAIKKVKQILRIISQKREGPNTPGGQISMPHLCYLMTGC